jgi:hypothetical protein
MFAISIGILILMQSGCIYVLKTKRVEIDDQNIEWDSKEMKSRQIQRVTQHEKCKFPYIKNFEDSQLSIIEGKKLKKKARTDLDDDEHAHDEYSFDASEMDYAINENDDEEEYDFNNDDGGEQYGHAGEYNSGTGGNYENNESEGRQSYRGGGYGGKR